nr:hypothetical protein [Tanacetum cinerariifolium]
MEDVFNHGRMIDDLDKDEGIELVKDADIAKTEGRHAAEQAKKQTENYHLDSNHSNKVLNVVTAASQVSAASATISAAKPSIPAAAPTVVVAYTRRRKGVIIRDPEEKLSSKTPAETPKLKDKGKGILIETPKPMKKKDQIELDAKYARKLHEEINKDHEEINEDIDWDAAIDHVNQKSKNRQYIKRYQRMKKRPQTERMSYDEICIIFQARFDANMRFLFKSREEMEEEDQEVLKSINETPAQKAAKRRKLNEEAQEAEDLKKRLEVVDDEDDDVFIEATPLARKVEEESEMSLELLRFTRQQKKPQSESKARKNMISYLKNTEGYKMEFFKGKTYDEILPIFQARFDANMKFLFKSREEMEKEDEKIIKSINETPAQKAAKRRKLSEEA